LNAWYEESGRPDAEAFIFPSRNGTPISPHNYLRRDVLKPAAKSVGIKGLTFRRFAGLLPPTSTGSGR
jgi:hypothetical protein